MFEPISRGSSSLKGGEEDIAGVKEKKREHGKDCIRRGDQTV